MFWMFVAAGLLLLNVALQVMDTWTTTVALQAGGQEVNAVSLYIMEQWGIAGWAAVKMIIIAAFAFVLANLAGTRDTTLRRIAAPSAVIAAWMGVVVVNNLQVLQTIA